MNVFAIVNLFLALLLWLLLMRLIVTNWARGGAVIALMVAFLVLLVAFDPLIAIVASVLMLLFVPNLARGPLGGGLMKVLLALTDPAVDLVRRATAGRVQGGAAVAVAALFVLGLRIVSFIVLRS